MGRPNVEHVRQLSASLKTGLPAENFQVGFIERMPFPDAFADVVLCNSILRFTYVIGDGSEWFLVDQQMLLDLSEKMNAVLVDPLKTTIVQDYRCMTTWVLRKRT
jgi:tellurite methyltransferase